MKALEDFVTRAKILIVDDEPVNVYILESFLEDGQFANFLSTSDPREVRKMFLEYRPDLVLLDLMMPALSGYEVMEQLRAEMAPDNEVPIMVLTADASKETAYKSLEQGASEFLTKPFDLTELGLRVRNLLKMRFLQKAYQARSSNLEDIVGRQKSELDDLEPLRKKAMYEERLHAFSQIAGGVVHDFNNCLTILQGCSDLLLAGTLDPIASRELLEAMHTAAYDASAVVGRLKHFYKPNSNESPLRVVDLADILGTAIKMSEVRWREQAAMENRTITLQSSLEAETLVECNPSEVREAIMNLIFNAVDAMPDGGTLSLSCSVQSNRAVIELSDTGAGMTEEVRSRCLEPFFSTKGDNGTGLGLAMVHGIIRRHGGEMEIESELGKGTTFKITLPLTTSVKERAHETRQRLDRSISILVAEDDRAVQCLLRSYLEREGHRVTLADDGEQALELFGQDEFDLLLTDLSMPRMNGEILATKVKEQCEGFPVIMLTGFDKVFLPEGKAPNAVDVLRSKPISAEVLSSTIAGVMLQY